MLAGALACLYTHIIPAMSGDLPIIKELCRSSLKSQLLFHSFSLIQFVTLCCMVLFIYLFVSAHEDL